jgi:predicted GH43/DUF377 family glycosyl hydrolase
MNTNTIKATRIPTYPIIQPRTSDQHWWERNGTFNPGVTEYQGKVVLLYRAYDDFRISRLGYAESEDGINFTLRDNPAIDTNPNDPFERLGIEDPRITKLDDTYYILHTSASYHEIGHIPDVRGSFGYIPWRVRVGMRTTKDFISFQNYGVILPDIKAKNAFLLPEKVNGEFAVFYREHTETGETLKVSYSTDFKSWHNTTEITWTKAETWEGFKFGAGSQPIKTEKGWLMVYHAVSNDHVYRLGLMLLDLKDPSKIIWHQGPILEPETDYEKMGFVNNVVYTCGVVQRDNELWIYYGAGDRVIGRATLSLDNIIY